jgi:5,10-methylenetetrahydrofolate reductase
MEEIANHVWDSLGPGYSEAVYHTAFEVALRKRKRVHVINISHGIGGHHSIHRAGSDQEGIKICVEQIQELREIEGVHGVHIMAIEWEQMTSKITEMAGLLPRPKLE